MKTGRLVSKGIIHFNDDTVAHVDIYLWARPLAVDANNRPRKAIGSCINPSDIPVVVNNLSENPGGKAKEKKNECKHGDEMRYNQTEPLSTNLKEGTSNIYSSQNRWTGVKAMVRAQARTGGEQGCSILREGVENHRALTETAAPRDYCAIILRLKVGPKKDHATLEDTM